MTLSVSFSLSISNLACATCTALFRAPPQSVATCASEAPAPRGIEPGISSAHIRAVPGRSPSYPRVYSTSFKFLAAASFGSCLNNVGNVSSCSSSLMHQRRVSALPRYIVPIPAKITRPRPGSCLRCFVQKHYMALRPPGHRAGPDGLPTPCISSCSLQ